MEDPLEPVDVLMVLVNTFILSLLTVLGSVLVLSSTPGDVKAIGALVGVPAGSILLTQVVRAQIARYHRGKETTETA